MLSWRLKILRLVFVIFGLFIFARLFYWQIFQGEKLSILASSQRFFSQPIPASRGKIFSSDNFPLATNQRSFLLFALLPQLEEKKELISSKLAPIILDKDKDKDKGELLAIEEDLNKKLSLSNRVWVALAQDLEEETKEKIENLGLDGLGFEAGERRFYPEASMSAHLLGFVGKDISGQEKGYFGAEGFYDLQLKGIKGFLKQERDIFGQPILIGGKSFSEEIPGFNLVLYLNRAAQFMVEEKLKEAVAKYGAKQGSVVVMDPKTGGILAMASFPDFNPINYAKTDESLFSNPVIADAFEPGSIFKVLVMSAALDSGVVKPEDRCPRCDGPVFIDKYVIKTWDGKYHPNSTMTEILQNSDNVGMVFVAEKLGVANLLSYLRGFGLGKITEIDLEGEQTPALREEGRWSLVDLYTASFGQGVAVTGIQMLAAVAAIANEGRLVKPQVVAQMISNKRVFEGKPQEKDRVISPTTAKIMTEMMVEAAQRIKDKWLKTPDFRIAGKSGTAQIPIAGHYDEEKTVASFVGFAPADNPRFMMLVTLQEPTASPWAEGTAAPLWFEIAKELFFILNISP